jgi:ribosomal protein S18 acetylase RimI-like enzyme
MIKLMDMIRKVEMDIGFVSPDDIEFDYYTDLNRIEKESGINILSDKNLSLLAIKDERVVGALYTGLTGDEFSFYIIVDKTQRGQGIGKKLIDYGLSEFQQLPEDYELKLDVVNPDLVNHLLKRGLKVVGKTGGHTTMTL